MDEDGQPIFKEETFRMKPEKVIEDNERSKISLKSLEKVILRYSNQFQDYGEDSTQLKIRLENNEVAFGEIRNRLERKQYQAMTKDLKYNDPEDDADMKAKQEFRFTLAFGFGFITLMFLAFVCGYFLGKKIFNLTETGSLILSLIVGIGTIILETILFVIRMEKLDNSNRSRLKTD